LVSLGIKAHIPHFQPEPILPTKFGTVGGFSVPQLGHFIYLYREEFKKKGK